MIAMARCEDPGQCCGNCRHFRLAEGARAPALPRHGMCHLNADETDVRRYEDPTPVPAEGWCVCFEWGDGHGEG